MESIDTVDKVLEIDPIVNLDYETPPEDIIRKGPVDKTVYAIGASNYTNNNLGFQNISPASLTTITSREFCIKYELIVAVTFPTTGNNAVVANYYPYTPAVVGPGVARAWPLSDANPQVPVAPPYVAGQLAIDPPGYAAPNAANPTTGNSATTFCLRAWPLQSTLSSLELFLNGNSITVPQNDIICLQPYLMSNKEIEYFSSSFPCQRDNGAAYQIDTAGNNRNPFASFNVNTDTQSRASFLPILIAEALAAGVVTRVYKYSITESLCISPLVWGKCANAEGFANIVNISINMTIQNINRTLSSYNFPGLTVNPATVVMTASIAPLIFNAIAYEAKQPQFLPTYLTQDPVLSAKMSSKLLYDYDQLLIDANSNAITVPLSFDSADGDWNGNALRSNIIPDVILVYIKPRKGNAVSPTVPDNFLRITKLTMQIGNRASVFNTFTEEDLHKMTVRNGINLSMNEWKYGVGSVIQISVPSDVGLISDESSGQTKFTMIKIDGEYSCSNLAFSVAAAQLYDVITILVTHGKAEVSPGTMTYKVGGVTSTDVLALTSTQNNVVASGFRDHHHSRGGSLFSKVGKLLHRGLQYAKHVRPEHIEMAQEQLDKYGLGGSVVAGRLVKRRDKHRRVL